MNVVIIITVLLALHCQAEIPQLKLILDKAVPNSRASYNSYQDVCKHMEYQLTMVCDCNYVAVRSILNSDSFSGLLIFASPYQFYYIKQILRSTLDQPFHQDNSWKG